MTIFYRQQSISVDYMTCKRLLVTKNSQGARATRLCPITNDLGPITKHNHHPLQLTIGHKLFSTQMWIKISSIHIMEMNQLSSTHTKWDINNLMCNITRAWMSNQQETCQQVSLTWTYHFNFLYKNVPSYKEYTNKGNWLEIWRMRCNWHL